MSYFARLAQRSGIAAPQTAATQAAAMAASVSPLEQHVEIVASLPQAQPAPAPSATAAPAPTAEPAEASAQPIHPAGEPARGAPAEMPTALPLPVPDRARAAPAAVSDDVVRPLAARDAASARETRRTARTAPPAAAASTAGATPAGDGLRPAVPVTTAAEARRDPSRAATMDRPRDRSAPSRRGGPVEVRIGTVTLQVRSPPPAVPVRPAPASAAPARGEAFSPHRHYLRTW